MSRVQERNAVPAHDPGGPSPEVIHEYEKKHVDCNAKARNYDVLNKLVFNRKEVSLQKQRKVDNSRKGTLRQGSQGPFAPRQKPYEETVEEPEEMRQEMKLQGSATVTRAAPKMNCAKGTGNLISKVVNVKFIV